MSINRQMAKGAVWTVGLRMFDRAIGFISTLILARLLMPEDFGLVAMATVFLHLLIAVSDFSVQVPLIQKATIDRHDMDSAWTLQCMVGLGQAGLLAALAHPVSAFYGEPRLVPVMFILALVAGLGGVKNIGIVMFLRDMTFNLDFVVKAIPRVIAFIVTVFAALAWRTYWALLIGMVVSTLVAVIVSYLMHPFRPCLSTQRWRELITFSKWMLLTNLFSFVGTRAPDFFLGRLFGPRSVGLYSVSFEIAMLPATELVAPINRVALPGYSRIRQEEGSLQDGFLDVIGLISIVAVPAALGVAAIADLVVPLLLGEKWLDAVPVIQYLAIAGAITVLMTNSFSILLALGRPALLTMQQFARMLLLLPGLYIGAVLDGVKGVAVAYVMVSGIVLALNNAIVLKALALPFSRYLRVVYRPIAGAVGMFFIVKLLILPWLKLILPEQLVVGTLLSATVGAVCFVVCVLFLWVLAGRPKGAERRIAQILSGFLKVRAPSFSAWLDRVTSPH